MAAALRWTRDPRHWAGAVHLFSDTKVGMYVIKQQTFQEYSPNLDGHECITQIKQNMRTARFTEAVPICQAFHVHYCMSFSWQPYKVNAMIIPILLMTKLRLREIRKLPVSQVWGGVGLGFKAEI